MGDAADGNVCVRGGIASPARQRRAGVRGLIRTSAVATAVALLLATGLFAPRLGRELLARRDAPVGAAAPVNNRLFLDPEQRLAATKAGLLPTEARSILLLDRRLRYGDFVWDERGAPAGKLLVRVNLGSQTLSVFRGGSEIGTGVILYGAEGHETPIGTLSVIGKFRDHRSATYDAEMPFTLRLTQDGVAIHGSDVRFGHATHGCIGLPLEFARHLYEVSDLGDEVQITTA